MPRKYQFIIILLMAAAATSNAQTLELKDLNIPDAPAFTILDHSPSVIDRPGTAKAFSASIVNLVTQPNNGLPKNFAIEVAPFWFFKNNLNVYRYLGIDSARKKQTNIFTNIRNTSISTGSVFKDSVKTHPYNANYFAVGIRANIVKLIRSITIRSTDSVIKFIAARQTKLLSQVTTDCVANNDPTSPAFKTCLSKGLEKAYSSDAAMTGLEERLQKLLAIKPLFQMDIAYAGSWAYKDNSIKNNHSYRSGVWATLAFNYPFSGSKDIEKMIENKNYINLYGTLRYITEDSTTNFKSFTRQNLLDVGGRLELELDRFSLSFETIHRSNQTDSHLNTTRNVGILQYKISEKLFLSGTVGKNFGSVNNLLALFGLNWGFGKQSIIDK